MAAEERRLLSELGGKVEIEMKKSKNGRIQFVQLVGSGKRELVVQKVVISGEGNQ